ncbi:MAG TPA: hypothetical protein VGH33_27280, partial [Isosphaeraceae bacterium]
GATISPVTVDNLHTQVLLTSVTTTFNGPGTYTMTIAASPDTCRYPRVQFDLVVGQPVNLQTFVSPDNHYGPYDLTILAASATDGVLPSSEGVCPNDQPPSVNGLTIGYWKTHDYTGQNWTFNGQPVTPTTTLASLGFNVSDTSLTLTQALSLQGGPSLQGKQNLMLKQAVGSFLNALAFGPSFGMTPQNVVKLTNAVLASTDSSLISYYQGFFEALNSVDNGGGLNLPNVHQT